MTCSTRREACHSQLDGANWHFNRESTYFNNCTPHALTALHPPLPPRTHVLVKFKHLTTITPPVESHFAAASPPNFILNHCNCRRLPTLSARALHPSQKHKLAAQWSNVSIIIYIISHHFSLNSPSSNPPLRFLPCCLSPCETSQGKKMAGLRSKALLIRLHR